MNVRCPGSDPATSTENIDGLWHLLRALTAAAADTSIPLDPDRLDRRDPTLIRALLGALDIVNKHYFRIEVTGLENIPDRPALFVANHNGGILGPDLAATMGVLWTARGSDAPLYAMVHDFAMRRLTPLGRLAQRLGGLRATQDNALRVLSAGGQVLAYPGGELDAFRHFRLRNEVVFGPRIGFVRVAQTARVPIVPIVAQGAHRSAIVFHEGRAIARALRLKPWGRHDLFPFALALPWGLAIGPWLPYLPLPHRVRLRILRPLRARPQDDPNIVRDGVHQAMQQAMCDLGRRRNERARPDASGSSRSIEE